MPDKDPLTEAPDEEEQSFEAAQGVEIEIVSEDDFEDAPEPSDDEDE